MRTLSHEKVVRSDLLWEMHNASNADNLRKLENLVPPEPAYNASKQEKENYQYKKAVRALAAEWFEWAGIHEHDHRCQLVNDDLRVGSRGEDHVGSRYKNLVKGWVSFGKYLKRQIESGHTVGYDSAASNANWIGKEIVAQIEKSSTRNYLRINEKAAKDWQNGKRPHIMDLSKNPFLSHD